MLARRAYISRSRLVGRPPEEGSRKWLIGELDRYTSLIGTSSRGPVFTRAAAALVMF